MSRRSRPPARHRSARTATATLSKEKALDEAAAILADIEGPGALRHVLVTAESDRPRPRPPARYQAQRNHRHHHMPVAPPLLGIFWAVTDPNGQARLLALPCTLTDAEAYGDCLTSPAGHYETWEAWRSGRRKPALTLLAPIIARAEYEQWPRGRIVYERLLDRFVIYADHQLLAPPWLAQIKANFHLPPERTIARSDLHYRSRRSIGPP